MRRFKWVLVPVAILVGLVAITAAVGLALPADHVATRSLTLAQPADSVWPVVSDVAGYDRWWDEVESVEPLPDRGGHPVWNLRMSTGPLPLEVTEVEAPTRLLTTIASDDLPFGGTWTYVVVPEGAGTRVTITEEGRIGNPLFRFMTRFVFGYSGTIESYLRALAARYGEEARITGA